MTLFLTSSPGGYYTGPERKNFCGLNESNGFVKNLKACWRTDSRVLFISASPEEFARNDEAAGAFQKAFSLEEMSISEVAVCDGRSSVCDLKPYDVIILGGGHVPTQNAFFQRIGLREAITGFEGIVIGISAGTMNSAMTVYVQPELPGEAIDPAFSRFIPGLGLTEIMVLPHYQMLREETLDGLRIIEDITLPDSVGRKIYLLVDGSYILVKNGTSRLFGEGYLAEDGSLRKICGERESILIL